MLFPGAGGVCVRALGIDMRWDTKSLKDKRLAVPDDFDDSQTLPTFAALCEEFSLSRLGEAIVRKWIADAAKPERNGKVQRQRRSPN